MAHKFDYYYGHEAEQFSFYKLPKLLFTDNQFKKISCEAKVLYGLMLDRMGLSIKNDWVDAHNHVYIIFTLEVACEFLNCGKDKGVTLFKELEESAGLIERKRQGQGKPTLIYVKNFITDSEKMKGEKNEVIPKKEEASSAVCTAPCSVDTENGESDSRSLEFGKTEVKTSDNQKSKVRINRGQDFGKTDPNKTYVNELDSSDTEIQSIYQKEVEVVNTASRKSKTIDTMDRHNTYKQVLYENLEYAHMAENYSVKRMDSLVGIMLEVICSSKQLTRIGGEDRPTELVRSRFLKLDCFHIEYVFEVLDKTTTKIWNIKNYYLTALYNSLDTIDQYYSAEVNHDLYGCQKE